MSPKKAKKRAEGANSNVFSMFEQTQIQEFKEAFTIMDQNRDGFIDKNDLRDTFAALGRVNVKNEEIDEMIKEAPGPINFTVFLTMFGEKLKDRPDVRRLPAGRDRQPGLQEPGAHHHPRGGEGLGGAPPPPPPPGALRPCLRPVRPPFSACGHLLACRPGWPTNTARSPALAMEPSRGRVPINERSCVGSSRFRDSRRGPEWGGRSASLPRGGAGPSALGGRC
uniref:Myosin light chain 2 n=1 Tax=Oryctolagus cuniculus TaxID=9986 RepID=A0A5F9C4V4_RABIT